MAGLDKYWKLRYAKEQAWKDGLDPDKVGVHILGLGWWKSAQTKRTLQPEESPKSRG